MPEQENITQKLVESLPVQEEIDYSKITELTDNQQLTALKEWNDRPDNPPSIDELSEKVFGKILDKRCRAIRTLKDFLATRKIKIKPTTYQPVEVSPLTEEQKEFIGNHCTGPNKLTTVQMAKELYNNSSIQPLSAEVRQIYDYIQSLPANIREERNDEEIPSDYKSPKTTLQAAARVNKYILNCIKPDEIEKSSKLQECLTNLIKFTHMYRFIRIYNSFNNPKDRELFEAEYIRFSWDKPDLQEMELDLLCNLCCDIVNYTNMQKELEILKEMRDESLNDSDGKKLSMSLVEEMAGIRKEMDDNHKRQVATTKMLEGSRNERLDLRNRENSTLTQLIDFWKNYENRQQILALAEVRKKKIKDEIQRIENLDDLKIQVWGISKEELLT